MGNETERKFSRRKILIAAGTTAALAACDAGSILQSEQDRQAESLPNIPQMGDVIVVGNKAQLLSDGFRYQIRDLPTYMRRSKSRRNLFTYTEEQARKILAQYPQGEYKPFKFGLAQGDVKRENQDGGEKLILGQGFLSSDSRPNLQIIPREDTFVALRKRLKSEGWDPDPSDPRLKDILFLDSYIFSYQEDELKTYGIEDTFIDPEINKGTATKFIKKRIEQNPFDQNNGFGHSLGGLWILEMAMKYPYAFNNLVFINSPIRGIPRNPVRWAQTQVLRELLKPFGLDPAKVTDHLFNLWDNPDYQKKLKDFFVKYGRKIKIVYTEGDIIIPKESTIVEGAEVLSISAGNVNPFNPLEVFAAHGMALKHEKVLALSSKTVGKNLSTS